MDAAASVDQRARDVVEYLIVAWRRVFRLMTAGQAMAALGLAPDPQVRARLAQAGQNIVPREQQTPDALVAHHKAEIEKWWPIIRAAGIKPE